MMKPKDKKMTAKCLILALVTGLTMASPAFAAGRTEIMARATVPSFGTYSFEGVLAEDVTKPGLCELGTITVKGTYNGPYPWVMRIYTDNLNFAGAGEGFGTENSAGLVSKDGKYTLPLQANCANWGMDEWLRIPDLNEEGYKPYSPTAEVGVGTHTDRIITAIDPRNADWVSGPDRVLFTPDDNILGDITMETPFDIKFRTNIGPNTPMGNYEGRIYIEIVPAP